tara:strand:- start:157 stop:534 length:378 start_codon:yes stop_codon:yes gene_type:complete
MFWFSIWLFIVICWLILKINEPKHERKEKEAKMKREKQTFEENKKRFFCPACFTELHSKSQQICHQCSKDIINPINYFDLPNDFNFLHSKNYTLEKKTKRRCIECGSVDLMGGRFGSYCDDCADG